MALGAAERMKNSRWVNKLEELADQLLAHLDNAPSPLPREPLIDPQLVDQLAKFTILQDDLERVDVPNVRFLTLGNGFQMANREKALAATLKLIAGVTPVNVNTVKVDGIGRCHFAAYTHPKGAMISSSKTDDGSFGSAPWHAKERIMMFRDAGDGRCIIYIAPIRPLLDLRTIGQHGVRWEDVARTAIKTQVIRSADALAAIAAGAATRGTMA